MSWDYDKLFAVGNYIGTKNEDTGKVYYHLINEDDPFDSYQNDALRSYILGSWLVWRIIKLNDNGEITEVVFDRQRDMPKPRPKLENGMFVRITDEADPFDDYGVVVGDKIVYRTGGWCDVEDEIPYIVAVWDNARCFDECGSSTYKPIWEKK